MTKLDITLSADKELQSICCKRQVDQVSRTILDIASDPFMRETRDLENNPGVRYIAVENFYILYYVAESAGEDKPRLVSIMGVLNGPYHPLH